MNFIHFINKTELENIKQHGISINDCYYGKGILVYPDKEINFKTFSIDVDLLEDEKAANLLLTHEKWERIGALGIRQNNGVVCGVKINLNNSHWPMKVFIDVESIILKEFQKLLYNTNGINYGDKDKLQDFVINTDYSSKFMLEMKFEVEKESDLKKLIDLFIKAGGGIWGAHSFDCMIKHNISPNLIVDIIEYEKK